MKLSMDWRIPASLSALLLSIVLVLGVVGLVFRPYQNILDRLSGSAARSVCIADARSALDIAQADVLIAVIDQDRSNLPALRAEIVNARDRIAHLNEVCPS